MNERKNIYFCNIQNEKYFPYNESTEMNKYFHAHSWECTIAVFLLTGGTRPAGGT
jgi:hypothetical protein